ncbi:unannotated protein [freshwater metagenome]|uniref:Unannotated protein n=1 Tax=freshwater metagenome TaxID=449393 RepID=A0A6J7G4L9_9ZZZZ
MATTDPRDDVLTVSRLAVLPLLQLDDRCTVLPRIVRTSQHHVQALGRLRQLVLNDDALLAKPGLLTGPAKARQRIRPRPLLTLTRIASEFASERTVDDLRDPIRLDVVVEALAGGVVEEHPL